MTFLLPPGIKGLRGNTVCRHCKNRRKCCFYNIVFFKTAGYASHLINPFKLFRKLKLKGNYKDVRSRMELIVTIVIMGQHPWTSATKGFILNAAVTLDPPPHLPSIKQEFFKLVESDFSIVLCGWMFSREFSKNLKKILFRKKS